MRHTAFIAPVALALSLGLSPISLAAGDRSQESKAVWDRHVQAALSGDLDAVMKDFTEDSVILTAGGVIEGKAAIRAFFEAFLDGATTAAAETVVNHEIIHDDIVVFNFSEGGRTFHDTAVIANGKIMVISTIDYRAN
jgi:uncharacterized protein (TIGR02246 family)